MANKKLCRNFAVRKTLCTVLFLLSLCATGFSQSIVKDSTSYNYAALNGYALDANIDTVLQIINQSSTLPLSQKSATAKNKLQERFGYEQDRSSYLSERHSSLDPVLILFHDYWRNALLHPAKNFDTLFINDLSGFLAGSFHLPGSLPEDSIDTYLKKYINNAGYQTTSYGRTGKLLDLLVWKQQYDTVYRFKIKKKEINTKVVFMDQFLTLGWEEYATLGRSYPGGWATNDALFCVKSAYDLESESFLVSYLAHEGNHLSDYGLFPQLGGRNLEYRSKLIELSLADKTLFETIGFFISNANATSENSHAAADYFVLRDLSRVLFATDLVTDIERWKSAGAEKIHSAAAKLYKKNTKDLEKAGAKTVKDVLI